MSSSVADSLPRHIFREYDIRGVVDNELTPRVVELIGQAFANLARSQGTKCVVVAGDVRLSTEELRHALIEGLNRGGVDVIDIGVVPTPILYFATEYLETGAGIVITGSHNPPEFNGLKFVLNRVPFAGVQLEKLYDLIVGDKLANFTGTTSRRDILDDYVHTVCGDISLHDSVDIAIDCGNGVTGVVARWLFESIGCNVTPIYDEPDGNFPNHHPDPIKPENLTDLIKVVRDRDLNLGIAFDGDGDRLGVVTNKGSIVTSDLLLAYFAKHILNRQRGAPIVFDVKCGRYLPSIIEQYEGVPIMWKTGHSKIKEKLRDCKAPLGGEYSGHICFSDRWYGFDDALYCGARLIEELVNHDESLEDVVEANSNWVSTPEIDVHTTDARKFQIVEDLSQTGSFPNGEVLTVDGLRVDYDEGWGLVRASNTSSKLIMRFEASSQKSLRKIQEIFVTELSKIAPDLPLDLHQNEL